MSNIPFSQKYLYDVESLCKEREEKHITGEEYSVRLDKIREIETDQHKSIGPSLIKKELIDAEKEVADKVKEEYQQKERLRVREQRDEEEQLYQERIKKRRDQNNFKNFVDDYIVRKEGETQKWQNRYNWLQGFALCFSIATTTMASMEGVPRMVVSIVGGLATLLGGYIALYKMQEKIYANRKALTEALLARQNYEHRTGDYEGMNKEKAYLEFSSVINKIQGQEMLQEVEFWNPKKGEDQETNKKQETKSSDKSSEKHTNKEESQQSN